MGDLVNWITGRTQKKIQNTKKKIKGAQDLRQYKRDMGPLTSGAVNAAIRTKSDLNKYPNKAREKSKLRFGI